MSISEHCSMKNLLLVMAISSVSNLASAALSNDSLCNTYYTQIQKHIQKRLYNPRPGNCLVEIKMNDKRITNIDIKEGTKNTCTDVALTFERILYKDIPHRPSETCNRKLTLDFQIPDTRAAEQEEHKAADNLKNRMHQQLQELKTN